MWTRLLIRLSVPVGVFLSTTGFRQQTHDEAIVERSSAVLIRRTVRVPRHPALDNPGPTDMAAGMRQSACDRLKGERYGWTHCDWVDGALTLEKRYDPGEAWFATVLGDTITFSLADWARHPLAGSKVVQMALQAARGTGRDRAFLDSLKASGFSHTLTLRMPAPIQRAWGEPTMGSSAMTFDLLGDWPAERRNWAVQAVVKRHPAIQLQGAPAGSPDKVTAAAPPPSAATRAGDRERRRSGVPTLALWLLGLAALAVCWPRRARPDPG